MVLRADSQHFFPLPATRIPKLGVHTRIASSGGTLHQSTKSTRENMHTVAAVDVVVTLVVVSVVVVTLVVVDEEQGCVQ